jgi:hypothetical protein
MEDFMEEKITFDIVKHIGTLSESKSGWRKELNLLSWNGSPPKYDIRDWSPRHEKLSKGMTFSANEAVKLKDLLIAELTG